MCFELNINIFTYAEVSCVHFIHIAKHLRPILRFVVFSRYPPCDTDSQAILDVCWKIAKRTFSIRFDQNCVAKFVKISIFDLFIPTILFFFKNWNLTNIFLFITHVFFLLLLAWSSFFLVFLLFVLGLFLLFFLFFFFFLLLFIFAFRPAIAFKVFDFLSSHDLNLAVTATVITYAYGCFHPFWLFWFSIRFFFYGSDAYIFKSIGLIILIRWW